MSAQPASTTTAQEGRVLVFDFRRNRERVLDLLTRAREFLRACDLTRQAGLLAPSVEHLNTAAELAVMTLIQLDGWNDKRQHRKRREWLREFCRYGNTPAAFAEAFDRLAAERNPARYAEGPQSVTSREAPRRRGPARRVRRRAARLTARPVV